MRGALDVENSVPELEELATVGRLGEEIGQHVVSRTVRDGHFVAGDLLSDEKITNVDVAGPLPARGDAVGLQLDGRLVVLIDGRSAEIISLSLDEVLGPDHLR